MLRDWKHFDDDDDIYVNGLVHSVHRIFACSIEK